MSIIDKLRASNVANISSNYNSSENVYEIKLTGEIGKDYNCVSFDKFMKSIDKNMMDNTENIRLFLNSPGGDVFEGDKIYNYLLNYKDKLDVVINGTADSMASILALAGKNTYITRGSRYMIHLPIIDVKSKNSIQIDAINGELKKWNEYFATIYQQKCKKPIEDIYNKLAKETYFTTEQALQYGFVDKIWNSSKLELPIVASSSRLETKVLEKILTKNFNLEIDYMINDTKDKLMQLKALKEELETEKESVAEMISLVEGGGPGSGRDEEKLVEETMVADEPVMEAPMEKEPVMEEPMEVEKPEQEVEAEGQTSEPAEPQIALSVLGDVIDALKDTDGNLPAADMKAIFSKPEKDSINYVINALKKGKENVINMKSKIQNDKNFRPSTKMLVSDEPVVQKHHDGTPKFSFYKN